MPKGVDMGNRIGDNLDRQSDRQTGFNIISLGFFCGVAQELERIGLRNKSFPFDWVISGDFEKVIKLIESNFVSFMQKNDLFQEYSINPQYYYDINNKIHFYHDFNKYQSFDSQFLKIKEKYQWRINRFYDTISHPTIFIRYVSSKKELDFIKVKEHTINDLLKKFNDSNELIYIIDNTLQGTKLSNKVFYVYKDKNDSVARQFLIQKPELENYLRKMTYLSERQINNNIKRKSIKYIKQRFKQIMNKLFNGFKKKNVYKYEKQYTEDC